MSKLCPSAQPGMEDCTVLGVVQIGDTPVKIAYLDQALPATAELLSLASPLKPTEIYRLAAKCAEQKCPHFDGADCRLASRVVSLLPAVVDMLPPCTIRDDCRWFSQEGAAACKRCPQITTVNYDLTPEAREVSGLPVYQGMR
jgi:hypothetical protein